MYAPTYALSPVHGDAGPYTFMPCKVLQLLAPGMNMYGPASLFVFQGHALHMHRAHVYGGVYTYTPKGNSHAPRVVTSTTKVV